MQHEATRLQIQSWIQIQMRMILIGGHQRTVQRTENRDERRENRGLRTSQRIENREKRKEKREKRREKSEQNQVNGRYVPHRISCVACTRLY